MQIMKRVIKNRKTSKKKKKYLTNNVNKILSSKNLVSGKKNCHLTSDELVNLNDSH